MVKSKEKNKKSYVYCEGNDIMQIDDLKLEKLPEKPTYQYLRGPIPLSWLCRAACIPGRALHVAVALWHISKLRKSKTVKMQRRILADFGISRGVYQTGLEGLEKLGLISVERNPGARSSVTILGNQSKS